jgi:hypothetical protein
MTASRCRSARLVLLLCLLAAVTTDVEARKRKTFRFMKVADPCGFFCQFVLCADPVIDPNVVLCSAPEVEMVIQIPAGAPQMVFTGPRSRRDVFVEIRGSRVHLKCFQTMLPCQSTCTTDDDCRTNSSTSHCVFGFCESNIDCR